MYSLSRVISRVVSHTSLRGTVVTPDGTDDNEDEDFSKHDEEQMEDPDNQDGLSPSGNANTPRKKKTRKNHRGKKGGSILNDSPSQLETGIQFSVLDENYPLPDISVLDTTPRKKKQLWNTSQSQVQATVVPESSFLPHDENSTTDSGIRIPELDTDNKFGSNYELDVENGQTASIELEKSPIATSGETTESSKPMGSPALSVKDPGSTGTSITSPESMAAPVDAQELEKILKPLEYAPPIVPAPSSVPTHLNVPDDIKVPDVLNVPDALNVSPSAIISQAENVLPNERPRPNQPSAGIPPSVGNRRLEHVINSLNRQDSRSKMRPKLWSELFPANSDIDRPKRLMADSPSFTPAATTSASTSASALAPTTNKGTSSITSQAANAAPFTPRALASGTSTPNAQLDPEIPQFNPAQREYTPQNYDLSQNLPTNGTTSEVTYDPFSMANVSQAIPTTFPNTFPDDMGNLAAGGAYFQGQQNYNNVQPLNYHFYAPIGPHKEGLMPYQKSIHDLFLSDRLREDLQRKSEAYHQVMPNALPQIGTSPIYHSLVALDTSQNRSTALFGWPSWVYKAKSTKDDRYYCLRRLEGYSLAHERAIRDVKKWTEVNSGGLVSFHDAFTTRQFKDINGASSLVIVTDYHPLSKTLSEVHFPTTNTNRYSNRSNTRIPENTLWAYISQISVAMKAIHHAKFAVRCFHLSKIILTDKNRIRLNACPIFDILHYEQKRSIKELQDDDLRLFGILVLSLATLNQSITPQSNPTVLQQSLDSLSHGRNYSVEFIDTIRYLLSSPGAGETKDLKTFIHGIGPQIALALDSSLQQADSLTSSLTSELENARLVRLMAKLGNINERPEQINDVQWSEVGDRYILKLFRDYVFHQVDENGRPVTDMAWILRCLNKLDAGSEEKVLLQSRDGENCFVVSFRELKRGVAAAWGDLQKQGSGQVQGQGKRF